MGAQSQTSGGSIGVPAVGPCPHARMSTQAHTATQGRVLVFIHETFQGMEMLIFPLKFPLREQSCSVRDSQGTSLSSHDLWF